MLIFLIGFMGCGKSFTSRQLSALLDIPAVDMDKMIEEREGKSIKEIFEEKGENYFRQLEHDFLKNLSAEDNLIIATGGGAPCFFDNMDIMNQKGLTIYLNRNRERCLAQLMKGVEKRPLLNGMSPEEIADFYDRKIKERKPFYEKAKWLIGDAEAEQMAEWIKERYLQISPEL
jgi:shikimate kinase